MYYMSYLIVNSSQEIQLDALNAQFTDRCVPPLITTDGISLVSAKLICNDVTWQPYQSLLTSLSPYSGTPTFPPPPI